MKAKRSNYAGVIALLLIGAAGVYGISAYVNRTPEAQHVADADRKPVVQNHEAANADKHEDQKSSATVLTPKSEKGNLSFNSATEDVPKGTDPMVFAVNRYFENSHIAPQGAKVLSVEVKEGVAYFDCTEKMEFSVGSTDEQTLLQGLSKTLLQFSDLKKAEFLISGKAIDSWGNVDISQGIDLKEQAESTTSLGA